jgi:hypothetical protein
MKLLAAHAAASPSAQKCWLSFTQRFPMQSKVTTEMYISLIVRITLRGQNLYFNVPMFGCTVACRRLCSLNIEASL